MKEGFYIECDLKAWNGFIQPMVYYGKTLKLAKQNFNRLKESMERSGDLRQHLHFKTFEVRKVKTKT
jgi:hypothetical protein